MRFFPSHSNGADGSECIANTVVDKDIDDILAFDEGPSVLIFISTPPSSPSQALQDSHPYEMDDPYPSGLHTDLKRDLNEFHKRQSDNETDMQAGLGLFEKYQFFTPGTRNVLRFRVVRVANC